jgi:hypothetical protein
MPDRPALLRALRENAAARADEAGRGRSARAIEGAPEDRELGEALDIFAAYLDFLGRPPWNRQIF